VVGILSVKREPFSLWLPKHPFRHSTAPRKALSARLLVGSAPGIMAKASKAGHSFKRLRHRASALGSPQEAPLPAWIIRRKQIAARYLAALSDLPDLLLLHYHDPRRDHIYQNYTIRSKQESEFSDYLKSSNRSVPPFDEAIFFKKMKKMAWGLVLL